MWDCSGLNLTCKADPVCFLYSATDPALRSEFSSSNFGFHSWIEPFSNDPANRPFSYFSEDGLHANEVNLLSSENLANDCCLLSTSQNCKDESLEKVSSMAPASVPVAIKGIESWDHAKVAVSATSFNLTIF